MVRLKERYLLVNIIYPEPEPCATKPRSGQSLPDIVVHNQPTSDHLTPALLAKGIRVEVAALFGDCGAGAIDRSLQVKYLSPATSTFIVRTSRAHYRLVWAALTFMGRVPLRDGRPCVFRVVHVSGTIRKVEQEAVRRARLLILQATEDGAARPQDALDSLFGENVGAERRGPGFAGGGGGGDSEMEAPAEFSEDGEMSDFDG